MIEVICGHCKKKFKIEEFRYKESKKRGYKYFVCSKKCQSDIRDKRKIVECKTCKKSFIKSSSEIKDTKNNFCCKSCAAKYNNKKNKHGIRRSKLEKYLEKKLNKKYPKLKIIYNDRNTLGKELDIYIPELNKAIEINGIIHYNPIHGLDKLKKIKESDKIKKEACKEYKINLKIINVSKMHIFSELEGKKIFNRINRFIKKIYD